MTGYTIVSAHYANPERTAVIIMTVQSGAVAISERDRPELWEHLMNSGVPISDMPNQPRIIDPGEPQVLSDGS
jgi:hypothetical protein